MCGVSVSAEQVSAKRNSAQGGDYSSSAEEDDDDDDESGAFLRDSAALKGGRGGVLEPGYLNIVRRVSRAGDGWGISRFPPALQTRNFLSMKKRVRTTCHRYLCFCAGNPGAFCAILRAQNRKLMYTQNTTHNKPLFVVTHWTENTCSLPAFLGQTNSPSGHLPPRCKDANQHDPAKATVRAVSFHPTGELLLAGGFDKTLRLFQVQCGAVLPLSRVGKSLLFSFPSRARLRRGFAALART